MNDNLVIGLSLAGVGAAALVAGQVGKPKRRASGGYTDLYGDAAGNPAPKGKPAKRGTGTCPACGHPRSFHVPDADGGHCTRPDCSCRIARRAGGGSAPPPESELDRAIVAYRNDPTPANHERLMALQRASGDRFMRSQGDEFIRRTKRRAGGGRGPAGGIVGRGTFYVVRTTAEGGRAATGPFRSAAAAQREADSWTRDGYWAKVAPAGAESKAALAAMSARRQARYGVR